MQFQKNKSSNRAVAIDMTPMIDIVFQLLIFFLVTAQMAQVTRSQLDLPKEKGEQEKEVEQAGLTINVLADGSIEVNGSVVSFEALDGLVDEAVARAGGVDRLPPLSRAARAADAAQLNAVFNRLSGRGLSAIRLATERSR